MFTKLLAASALVASASAHVALWDPGMFGYNYPYQATDSQNAWNNNEPVNPLRQSDGLSTDQWFGHGMKGYPPKAGDFMQLPAGGTYMGDLNCNRAGSKMRDPARTDPLPQYACDGEGALHVVNRFNNSNVDPQWFGGTALAIAYTSDVASLQPNDMTVISVNHFSVWFRETPYAIPAGLPPCPPGGCLCTWNWIHQSAHGEGYGSEIYNNLYRCTVTGNTDSSKVVGRGAIPRECSSNPSNCVSGPKTPMYLYQASGNNLPNLPTPPNYNDKWGFADGAQNDIFGVAATPAGAGAAAPTATALPDGWSSMGCYKDQDPRSLGTPIGGSTTQTISGCVAACDNAGFAYAGLEAGSECWCSNEPTLVSAPASDCKSPCSGDGWSTCGGDWRLSVYKAASAPSPTAPSAVVRPTPLPTASIPAGWSAVGCVIDSGSDRTLDSGSVTLSDNTVAKCIAVAESKGLAYAGVQYGVECWSGSAASGKNIKMASADECNVACGGDRGTVCGGSYRMNVYVKDSAIASTSAASSSVATSTSTVDVSTSTVAQTTAQSTASAAATSTSTSPSAAATTSTASSVQPTVIVPTTSTTPVAPTTTSTTPVAPTTPTTSSRTTSSTASASASSAASTALPSGWTSLGCQSDPSSSRLLIGYSTTSAKNTPQWCLAQCASRGYTYAGTEYSGQCFCSNSLSNDIPAKGISGCTYACTGDQKQSCGGWGKMNLYQNTVKTQTQTQGKRDAARMRARMAGGKRHLRFNAGHGRDAMAVH